MIIDRWNVKRKILPLELGSLLEELVEELVVRSLEHVVEQVDSEKFNESCSGYLQTLM